VFTPSTVENWIEENQEELEKVQEQFDLPPDVSLIKFNTTVWLSSVAYAHGFSVETAKNIIFAFKMQSREPDAYSVAAHLVNKQLKRHRSGNHLSPKTL